MSVLGETRSILKAEAFSLAAILAMHYKPMFGNVLGMYIFSHLLIIGMS
jgi:hypothetical protein